MNIPEILKLADEYNQELPDLPELPKPPSGADIARWIDHTLLKPQATASQIEEVCEEAKTYNFASVCINPFFVPLAAGLLQGTDVKTCSVIGFPLGATQSSVKVVETLTSLAGGATEIDMVMNIGAFKGEDYSQALNDILAVVQVAHNQGAIVKVILEMALLTRKEKTVACLLCKQAGADFVKTSTGFGPGGATVEDVDLMRRVVGSEMGVKAAGGVRTLEDALAMIHAGANRIGASAGVRIVKEAIT